MRAPWFRRGGACPAFARVETGSGFSHFVTSMTAPITSGWRDVSGGPCAHRKASPDWRLGSMPVSASSQHANSNYRKRKSTSFQEIHKFLIDPRRRRWPGTRFPDYSLSSRDLPFHVQIFEFSLFVSSEADVRHYLSLLNDAFPWRAWLALCHLAPHMLDGPKNGYEMIRHAAFRSSPKFRHPGDKRLARRGPQTSDYIQNAITQDADSMSIGRSTTNFRR